MRARLRDLLYRWALRGAAPEAAPIVLTHRRVFVLPTRAGIAFAVALVLMLIGAINYNLSLGYALVFLLAGLGIAAIVHSFRNLAHLSIAPGRTEPVFAGEKARFCIILGNARARPRPAVRLNLANEPAIELDVPAHASIEARLELAAPRRGWLAMPRVRLATVFPLGLVRAWSYAAPNLACLVYPAPAKHGPPSPQDSWNGTGSSGRGAGRDDFAGLRGHQPADPLRHVAWKAAARADDGLLMTKIFAGAAAAILIFDWDTLPATLDVEARLSLLTRWICDAHAAGHTWGLRLPQASFEPACDNAHLHACLTELALYGQR